MAFAAGAASFQRFYITGPMAEDIDDAFLAQLKTRAFGEAPALTDDTQVGWTGPAHLFDRSFEADTIAFGRYAHFAIRIDRLAIPPAVLRSYIRQEQEVAMEAAGRPVLGKAELRQAKETATLRAEQEVKAGHYRRMQSYPVLVDLERGVCLLGTTGSTVAEKLMLLFSDTFGAALEPAEPKPVAERLLAGSGAAQVLENLAPATLVRPEGEASESQDLGIRGLRFLGKELLTWLWFRAEANDATLRVFNRDDVSVQLDRTLRLVCDFGLTGTDVITAEQPTGLPEARAALATGKQPQKAGLVFAGGFGEASLTLDGPRFAVSRLLTPDGEADQDPRAAIEDRFDRIFESLDLLDAVYEVFLRQRTAKEWPAELHQMSQWAAGKPIARQLRMAPSA